MNKAQWYKFYSHCRLHGGLPNKLRPASWVSDDPLYNRWRLSVKLRRKARGNPFVFTAMHGMDCDGCTFGYLSKLPIHVIPHEYRLNKWYDQAEGPQYHYYLTPDVVEHDWCQPRSRDLAMEAHEDGHDHVLYY